MALKETNKNRKKISPIEAKIELHNHNVHVQEKPSHKCKYKLFFSCLIVFAIVSFFII
jgi:hypothetical protein